MSTPLISVVIPCYNYANYIKEAIQSVINQSYKNIELIVINDGSSDNSHEIIQALAQEYKFLYVNQKNSGVTQTSQNGLDLARGEFIKFLDADDKIYPNFLANALNALKDPNTAFVYANADLMDENSNIRANKPCKNCVSGKIFDNLVQDCFINTTTSLIRTSALKNVGGFDTSINVQDYQIWLKMAQKYEVAYINQAFGAIRIHANNMSKRVEFNIAAIHKTYLLFKDNLVVQKKINQMYLLWFRQLSKTPNKQMAKEYMRLAFRYHWYNHKFYNSVFRTFF